MRVAEAVDRDPAFAVHAQADIAERDAESDAERAWTVLAARPPPGRK